MNEMKNSSTTTLKATQMLINDTHFHLDENRLVFMKMKNIRFLCWRAKQRSGSGRRRTSWKIMLVEVGFSQNLYIWKTSPPSSSTYQHPVCACVCEWGPHSHSYQHQSKQYIKYQQFSNETKWKCMWVSFWNGKTCVLKGGECVWIRRQQRG